MKGVNKNLKMLDSLLDLIAIRDSPEFNQMSNSVETKYRMFHIYRVLGEMGGERERAGEEGRERQRERDIREERKNCREGLRKRQIQAMHMLRHTETYSDRDRQGQTEADRDIQRQRVLSVTVQ